MLPDNDLLELYTDIARQQLSYVEHRVNAFGLHAGQAAVIAALGEYGPCTQKKLTELRHVSAPTISVMISRMEREGLVNRQTADGRSSQISLTDKGWKLHESLSRDRVGEPERIFSGLTQSELEIAKKVFHTISKNLQQLSVTTDIRTDTDSYSEQNESEP